jgi:hypothetical protein
VLDACKACKCEKCEKPLHSDEAKALDLELENMELLPRAARQNESLSNYYVENWEPPALKELPVYSHSNPTWYGPTMSMMLWKTPVYWWGEGLYWFVGRRSADGQITWRRAEYGGCVVEGPMSYSEIRRTDLPGK